MMTMTAQRWCVRILSVAYYFVFVPFLYDLYMHGATWRSAYLLPFIVLGVAGLQIGFKNSDSWVRGWFWINVAFVAILIGLAFFYPPFNALVAMRTNEQWILFAFIACSVLALPLNHFMSHPVAKPPDEEEDLEEGLPPVPNQNPAK